MGLHGLEQEYIYFFNLEIQLYNILQAYFKI
jgi:hypothetical protein